MTIRIIFTSHRMKCRVIDRGTHYALRSIPKTLRNILNPDRITGLGNVVQCDADELEWNEIKKLMFTKTLMVKRFKYLIIDDVDTIELFNRVMPLSAAVSAECIKLVTRGKVRFAQLVRDKLTDDAEHERFWKTENRKVDWRNPYPPADPDIVWHWTVMSSLNHAPDTGLKNARNEFNAFSRKTNKTIRGLIKSYQSK